MNAEQALEKLESQFLRIFSEVCLFESLYSDRELGTLLRDHLHDLFARIQRPLLDGIVLGICRMLDPAETCGNDNLTLFYLLDVMPSNDRILKDRVEALNLQVRQLRMLRNKIIAHADLRANSSDRVEYLGASHDEVIGYIASIREILDHCSTAIRGTTVGYHADPLDVGGPEALKTILRHVTSNVESRS